MAVRAFPRTAYVGYASLHREHLDGHAGDEVTVAPVHTGTLVTTQLLWNELWLSYIVGEQERQSAFSLEIFFALASARNQPALLPLPKSAV